MRPSLKMFRVDTMSTPALVPYDMSFGYSITCKKPGYTMSPVHFIIDRHLSISIHNTPSPQPARVSLIYLLPESLLVLFS